MFEGDALPNVGLNAVAGRVPEEYGLDATSFDQMRPGCFDIHERIRDMNVNGVLGSLNFPSLAGFTGQLFSTVDDKDIASRAAAGLQRLAHRRLVRHLPGPHDPAGRAPDLGPAADGRRGPALADKGCHAVTFSENPEKLGYPELPQRPLGPVLAGVLRDRHRGLPAHRLVVAARHHRHRDAPIDTMITLQPMNIVQCAADLLWSPVLRKFPDLRIALSEGGIGWVPYFLERIDYVYEHHHQWTNQDFGDQLPSQVFNEHILTCFIDDAVGIEMRHHLNLDHIHWECDYPHSRLDVAQRPRDGHEVPRPACPTTTSTASRTSTPCGTSPTTPSPTSPASSAPSAPCGPRPATSTPRRSAYGTGKFQDEGIVTTHDAGRAHGQEPRLSAAVPR